MNPYTQTITDETILRKFSSDINSDELVWHRDRCDREILVVASDGWKFQFDDQLPFTLIPGMKFNISKETFHRVIKGDGDLIVEIIER